MKHQDTKAPRKEEARSEELEVRRKKLAFPSLVSYFYLSLCLGALVVNSAWAQVPAHTPSYAPEAFGATTTFQPTGKPLVRVNGAVLTDRDLLREMLTIFPYARIHNGFPKAMEPDIRAGAMKMIVFEELVYQEAKRRKVTIPPGEMARAMAAFRQQFHSPQEYQELLHSEFKGSPGLLEAKVERSLLIEKFLKVEVTDRAVVTPAEVKAYYDRNPELFRYPESFSFQSISILPPRNATSAQLQEVLKRAQDALRQAKASTNYEQFGTLAEKISDDDFRVMMGDHKVADRSKLPAVVATALAAMSPGQVSNLIEFDANDYTILRLIAHIPAGIQNFETIKERLHAGLVKDKTDQLRNALAARLSKTAKIEKA
ncbi:MAG TPA: peptidyl-prolyl cis-trans isomerase [Terriglobia bacterium]|nr:peptidyl-prolyl cis-trans isomerase [Terriglobia bacterium]